MKFSIKEDLESSLKDRYELENETRINSKDRHIVWWKGERKIRKVKDYNITSYYNEKGEQLKEIVKKYITLSIKEDYLSQKDNNE